MKDDTTERATQEIPYGYCHCGCGQKTAIIKKTNKRDGLIKGQPRRFIHNHHTKRNATERFWEKVNKGTPEECWNWTAAKRPDGYGNFSISHGIFVAAHRFAYELAYGPIPEGLLVCHKCNNPSCCNPAHLYAGSQLDNMNDAKRSGRTATDDKNGSRTHPESYPRGDKSWPHLHPELVLRGSKHKTAKLTEAAVLEIRKLYAIGAASGVELSQRFGVSRANISLIVNRKAWKHIL